MNALRRLFLALGLVISYETWAADLNFNPRYQLSNEQISAADFLTKLQDAGYDDELRAFLVERIQAYGVATSREALDLQLQAYFETVRFQSAGPGSNAQIPVPRFPVLPLASFAYFTRAHLEQAASLKPGPPLKPALSPRPLDEEVAHLFATDCSEQKFFGPELLPGLKQGHPLNLKLSRCQIHQSLVLARLMTRLARPTGEDAGKSVEFLGQSVSSAEELMERLVATGHRVLVKLEKTYADFFTLNYEGRSVVWPVWLDTGLSLGKTLGSLIIPSGHSQIAWEISGPQVNADITFFLGTDGAGFFGRVNSRPRWTGWASRPLTNTRSRVGKKDVIHSVHLAEEFLRRNQTEAMGLPHDGYGHTGVCNDAAGFVESGLGYGLSVYPMARNPELKSHLPQDVAASHSIEFRAHQIERVAMMQPVTKGSLFEIEPRLALDIQKVRYRCAQFFQ